MPDTLETYRTVTPYLVVPDADAELKFLVAAFGATEKFCQRNDKGAVDARRNPHRRFAPHAGTGRRPVESQGRLAYLWVPNVDEVYAKALAAGATSESAPEDKPYGHRNAGVVDTAGITWWIGSPVK